MQPKFLHIASLLCLLLAAPCFGERRHPPATQGQPEVQPAPAPPPTLAELPASPPEVSFKGGQLTISAQNSTLGDILKAVRTQTGATIDLPGTAPERVVGQFGPAPARDVLAALLNGSHFNFVLLGSPTDPGALDRVILMAKSSGSPATNSQPTEQAANNQTMYARPMASVAAPMSPAPGGNTVVVEGQDAQEDATDDSADATTDDAQATDDQTDQTDQATDDQATTDDQQQQDGQQNVKTPEQLLQELQQRQQQMQQQGVQPGVPPGLRPGFPNPGAQPGDGTTSPPHN